jgi:uncharacterized protein YfaS (alpha-2-macroglobulin family)
MMHSNLRTNAIILQALLDTVPDSPFIEKMVTWILAQRKNGAWRNTQENALALMALSEYFRLRESKEIDFTFQGRAETIDLGRLAFKEIRKEVLNVAMAELIKVMQNGQVAVDLAKEGKGRLYWGVNLSYFPVGTEFDEVSQGFTVQRIYEDLNSGQRKSSFKLGDLIRVRLIVNVTAARTYVVLNDPIPAGTEVENSFLQTTSREAQIKASAEREWYFYHVEPYDDRLIAFADQLPQGSHEFVYVIRATSSGTFLVPAAKAEEMYNPEVFGISKGNRFTID